MNISAIKTFLGNCVKANVNVPSLLVGTMGVGKSQIMQQVAQENNLQLVDLRLAQMESGDIIGMPYKNGDGRTHWAAPEWWPKENTRGIIFLDELNRAPTDIRQAVFQLVLDRKLHTHKLPDGWFVHAAVNPDNGNYQVESLDPAMLRRFCAIEVTPDVDVWLAWAKGKLENKVTEFISAQRSLLYQAEAIKLDVKPTPDSYRMLNELLVSGVVGRESQMEIFRGLIGKEAAVAFIKYLDTSYEKPVTGTQVLTQFAQVKTALKKQRTDENYVTITDLCACLKGKKSLPAEEFKNLVDFTLLIPKESQTAFISKLDADGRSMLLRDQKISKLLVEIISQ